MRFIFNFKYNYMFNWFVSLCARFDCQARIILKIPYQKEMGKYCTQLERLGITFHGNLSCNT